jgi:hypothetical protein
MTEREIRLSFHGHTSYSDGVSSIHDLVEAAGAAKLDFFGASDHNSTSGLKELNTEIDKYNQRTGAGMHMVSAVEITVGADGHIVFATPGFDPQFIVWADRVSAQRCTYNAIRAIFETVADHGTVVSIVHPGVLGTRSLSLSSLRTLGDSLPEEIKKNVGIEVSNWMSQIFQPHTALRELELRKLAQEYDFATFGGSDYHAAWMIPMLYTQYVAQDATEETFLSAVHNRTVIPSKAQGSMLDMMHLAENLTKSARIAKQKNIV